MGRTKHNQNRMKKIDLIRKFAKKLEVSQAVAEHIIEVYQETILDSLKVYDSLTIGEVIIVEKAVKPEQTRILNGESITTPEHKILKARITGGYRKL